MSDLTSVSDSMGVPEPLVERAARAWAEAAGSSYDDVLAAWGGGGAVATAPPPASEPAEDSSEDAEVEPKEDPTPSAQPAEPATPTAQPADLPVAAMAEHGPDPEEVIEPTPLGERLAAAARIGAWSGAALGLIGIVIGSTWLLGNASVTGSDGVFAPAVDVMPTRVIVGVTLLSVVFGVVVAALSRGVLAWSDRGARLEGRTGVTIVLGAVLGLVLGVSAAGVMISAFSTPLEAVEGVVTMDIVPSLIVVVIGGAVLGAITAALVQLLGVPAGISETDADDIQAVRSRLSAAISIPVAATVLLAILVVPLGLTFIRSNELTSGAAAVLAIFAASAILGLATLAASRPHMRISFGEFLVAFVGIATVVVILFAVFSSMAEPEEHEEDETGTTEETDESAEGTESPEARILASISAI